MLSIIVFKLMLNDVLRQYWFVLTSLFNERYSVNWIEITNIYDKDGNNEMGM